MADRRPLWWQAIPWLGVVALAAALALPCSARARNFDRLPGRLVVRARAGLENDALQRILQRNGARRINALTSLGATVIDAPEEELAAVESALRRSGLFRSVERDYFVHIADDPNDPYYNAQWGMPRIGTPAAWDITSGSGVIVGVIDTGVDAAHPDLQGQLLAGYDFVNGDADPQDDHGHGTRMSGIIAAHRNNGEGIAGVAPDAMVLPVKVLDSTGSGVYSDVASGIVYAVDQGARVLNLSLAGPVASNLLQDAVDYAVAHDVVVVAAAGNSGSSEPAYPAAATGAVAVAALDQYDAHPSFSNSGAWISFAAPGVDIVTTSPAGAYSSSTGTSPAAAFGTGVFALLFSANPSLPRSEALARVQNGCVDVGTSGWDPFFGAGRLDAYAALVPGGSAAPPPDLDAPEATILSPTKSSLVWGMVPVDVDAVDDVAIARVELMVDSRQYATATTPPYQFVVDTSKFEAGRHKLRAYVYDTSDRVGESKSVKVSFTPGTGLLVGRVVAKSTSLTITADFALPAGTAFDANVDDMIITLSSAKGTVLSAIAHAGDLTQTSSGRMSGTLETAVPSTGTVRVSSRSSGEQPVYRLKIKASRLSSMATMQATMNLGIQLGGAQLSQSLSFRSKGSTLIYP